MLRRTANNTEVLIWGEGFSLHVKQTEESVKVFNNLSEHTGFVGWGEFTNPTQSMVYLAIVVGVHTSPQPTHFYILPLFFRRRRCVAIIKRSINFNRKAFDRFNC